LGGLEKLRKLSSKAKSASDHLAASEAFTQAVHAAIVSRAARAILYAEPSEVVRKNQVPIGQWVTAEAPARIDLSGGWSDTPPICFETQGRVVGVAVKVDGKVRTEICYVTSLSGC